MHGYDKIILFDFSKVFFSVISDFCERQPLKFAVTKVCLLTSQAQI